jgi:ubiquinol-cytochrome c reductase cytochrome c subunit
MNRAARTFGLILIAATMLGPASAGDAVAESRSRMGRQEADTKAGGLLYEASCATCHASDGRGTGFGPSLEGVGAASVDFQLRTGRMPLSDVNAPTKRKPPAFGEEEIEDLVAYVDSLAPGGPAIPTVEPANANLADGAQLFLSNCAACHGASGNGGAVGGNAFAPSLSAAEPVEIAEATITGPGEMPRFNLSEADRNDIVRYVSYLEEGDPPGGLDIGGVGPVPEGFVAWVFAMGALVVIVLLIGRTRTGRDDDEA